MGNHRTRYNIDLLEPSKSRIGEDEGGNCFTTTFDKIKAVCSSQESKPCSVKSKASDCSCACEAQDSRHTNVNTTSSIEWLYTSVPD